VTTTQPLLVKKKAATNSSKPPIETHTPISTSIERESHDILNSIPIESPLFKHAKRTNERRELNGSRCHLSNKIEYSPTPLHSDSCTARVQFRYRLLKRIHPAQKRIPYYTRHNPAILCFLGICHKDNLQLS